MFTDIFFFIPAILYHRKCTSHLCIFLLITSLVLDFTSQPPFSDEKNPLTGICIRIQLRPLSLSLSLIPVSHVRKKSANFNNNSFSIHIILQTVVITIYQKYMVYMNVKIYGSPFSGPSLTPTYYCMNVT